MTRVKVEKAMIRKNIELHESDVEGEVCAEFDHYCATAHADEEYNRL